MKHAFTLIELLIVFAIICVLAAMLSPGIARFHQKCRHQSVSGESQPTPVIIDSNTK